MGSVIVICKRDFITKLKIKYVFRLTCWPIESHFELDCLEDIFKENGREGALKPVLSTILTPGLCAIYSKYSASLDKTTNIIVLVILKEGRESGCGSRNFPLIQLF